MRRLVVSSDARADLHSIVQYSRRVWGVEQARDYRDLIIKTFSRLMVRPERGRLQPDLGESVRRLNVRQHAIFYAVVGDEVRIARVLHQRQAIPSHLPGLQEG
jgi:toxin ParE1/3/4